MTLRANTFSNWPSDETRAVQIKPKLLHRSSAERIGATQQITSDHSRCQSAWWAPFLLSFLLFLFINVCCLILSIFLGHATSLHHSLIGVPTQISNLEPQHDDNRGPLPNTSWSLDQTPILPNQQQPADFHSFRDRALLEIDRNRHEEQRTSNTSNSGKAKLAFGFPRRHLWFPILTSIPQNSPPSSTRICSGISPYDGSISVFADVIAHSTTGA